MALANKHVLIADDDQLVRKTLKFHLEEAGYEVGTAGDGLEALRYLKAHSPAVVLLDVFMPESDGLEALLEIKKNHPNIKTIVMSGGGIKGHYEFLSMAAKFGADGVIRKPMSGGDLIAMLQADSLQFEPR
jgi:CheY-like chemotaxis protein